jgi:hypothetical protein
MEAIVEWEEGLFGETQDAPLRGADASTDFLAELEAHARSSDGSRRLIVIRTRCSA